jgi:hypothetical protein
MEAIVATGPKKREGEVSAAPPELQPNPLRLHQCQIRSPFSCRQHSSPTNPIIHSFLFPDLNKKSKRDPQSPFFFMDI